MASRRSTTRWATLTGDVVLMRVADRLKRSIRGADTVARCGGDEFLVIVNDLARAESCDQIAQTLRVGIEAVTIPGQEGSASGLRLGGSIGFALFPDEAFGRVGAVSTGRSADV